MNEQELLSSEPRVSPVSNSDGQTIGGFAPSTIVFFVAFTCLLGAIWGFIDGNWVLVATEIPAVLSLVGIGLFARVRRSGRRVAMIGSAVGVLCVVELWIATAVFGARGTSLVLVVAVSSGLTVGIGGLWAAWDELVVSVVGAEVRDRPHARKDQSSARRSEIACVMSSISSQSRDNAVLHPRPQEED